MCCRLQKQRQQTANGEQQTVNRVYRQVNTTRNLCAMRINSAETRQTRYEKLKSRWKRRRNFKPPQDEHVLVLLRLIIQMQPLSPLLVAVLLGWFDYLWFFGRLLLNAIAVGQPGRQTYWQLILGKIVNIFLWTFATWKASWPGHQIS